MNWITTVNGLIALITGFLGLIGTGIGAYFSIKSFIKATKEKSAQEVWNLIMAIADKSMQEVEKELAVGADKKVMVINSVKAGCAAAGIDITIFLDQLSAYIDQTISFVNGLTR